MNNELAHHGIIGQKWGVRRFQNPDGSLTELGCIRYGHKVIKNSKGLNVEKWGKSKNTNVLYITGNSGSGKSTLSNSLKNNKTRVIHLDSYFDNPTGERDTDFDNFLSKKLPDYRKISLPPSKISDSEWNQIVRQFEKEIENYGAYQYGRGNKVIVEGLHLADEMLFADKSYFKNKPIIITGANTYISMLRANARDNAKLSFNEIERQLKTRKLWDKQIKELGDKINVSNGQRLVFEMLA